MDEILSMGVGQQVDMQVDGQVDEQVDEQISEQLYRELVQEPEQEPEQEPDTRPIWPGRPEVIYQDYLARKAEYIAQHPRCRDYRKALGLKEYSKRICMEHHKFLPRQRLDLETETLLPSRSHWTEEEVQVGSEVDLND
jgi:hypothetical protein